jgi:hypothetical protein
VTMDDALFLAAGLSWGACMIHVEAAIDHFQESVLYAVFFAVLAVVQLLWGIAIYRRPSRRLLAAGVVMSLMVVALWIMTRTTGIPVGPERWTSEPVGTADSLASGDELVLALVVMCRLGADRAGPVVRGIANLGILAGVFLILLSSMVLTLGHHVH